MIDNMLEWLIFVGINAIDVSILWYVINNFVTPAPKFLPGSTSVRMPKLTLKIVGLFLFYGIATATFWHFFQEAIWYRITALIVVPFLIRCMTKETLRNSLALYGMFFVFVVSIQFPLTQGLQLFDLNKDLAVLIMQILTLGSVVLVCKNASFHRVFVFVKSKFNLKSLIFLILFIPLTWMLYDELYDTRIHFLFLTLVTIVATLGAYKGITYVMNLQAKFDDMSHTLYGINYLSKTCADATEIRKHLDETLEKIHFGYLDDNFVVGEDQENLITFIHNHMTRRKAKNELIIDVNHYYTNRKVPIPIMLNMLGILLDHAIQKKSKKPIFITMNVVGSALEITMKKPSENLSPIEIDRMFTEGYATKKDNGIDYGLVNLAKMVKNYEGDIITSCSYEKEYKSYYLELILEIK